MEHKPMDHDRLARLREFIDPASAEADLLSDRDWHRARVLVDENDIKRLGVTWAHVRAWSSANDDPLGRHFTMETPDWAARDAELGGGHMVDMITATIALAASRSRRSVGPTKCQLDVLDEIAAMEISS